MEGSMMLRLGIIGLSPGNGHPYSWSAIFNGYDQREMQDCGFPVIPGYLAKQSFPADCIGFAKVTHVWTQDVNLSHKVARAALIPNIAERVEDFIGQVDAVLLARDDAETHYQYAAPFLEAGLPIYIDKPLALSVAEARKILHMQKHKGQLFSCSALRYASELQLDPSQREAIGDLVAIEASVPKDWAKYAIHAVDPALRILGDRGDFADKQVMHSGGATNVRAVHSSGTRVSITALGVQVAPISIHVIGTRGEASMTFKDTFQAFRAALQDFVDGINLRDVRSPPERLLAAVELIEAGCRP
jgi:predicted dehydrogenase